MILLLTYRISNVEIVITASLADGKENVYINIILFFIHETEHINSI